MSWNAIFIPDQFYFYFYYLFIFLQKDPPFPIFVKMVTFNNIFFQGKQSHSAILFRWKVAQQLATITLWPSGTWPNSNLNHTRMDLFSVGGFCKTYLFTQSCQWWQQILYLGCKFWKCADLFMKFVDLQCWFWGWWILLGHLTCQFYGTQTLYSWILFYESHLFRKPS